jgi:acetyl-CoA carboxylase carboxyl transferase subunit alpha
VIAPEACGSIMWRDANKKAQAAAALKITSEDVSRLGCIDDVVPEPAGGAQNDPMAAATLLDQKLAWHLNELKSMPESDRIANRLDKFRQIAQFYKKA